MRRFLSVLCAAGLICALSIPAFAAAPTPYIPVIPKFVYVNGNSVGFTGATKMIEPTTPAYASFMQSLADPDRPWLLLIQQNAKNVTMDAAGEDYDHKYWLHYIRFPKSASPSSVGWFEYMNTTGSNPMRFCFPTGGDMVSYFYDHARDELTTSGKVEKHSYPISFSYVMLSSALSNPVAFYPNFDTLAGSGKFTFSSHVPGSDRHYNWWLSINGELRPPYKPEDHLNEDTDGDGKPDLNIDKDNDGEPDLNIDTDGNGRPDVNIDTDKDGKPDTNIDTDGDGKPDTNVKPDLDVDTDGDGKPDINIDTNGDGAPDLNVDTNGDNKPDINIDTNKDDKPDINIDTNGDGKPDINIDTDGDKKPDVNIDTNGDKKPDLNVDTNGDGKPDLNVDTNGDGKPNINVDTNGDGKPDLNVDTNGDGEPNINVDTNGDGKPDINVDTDNDGKPDTNIDADGDGKPDSGGSSSGGSSGGSNFPWDWFEPDDSDLTYDEIDFFNPFDYDYKPFEWDVNYDPAEGYSAPNMPEIPKASIPDGYQYHDPFARPPDLSFGDYWIKFGG